MKTASIILFDGVCNLCNGSVNFIIDHDSQHLFQFASLQSESGKSLMAKYQLDHLMLDTVVLIENDEAYLKSTAALKILKQLPFPYSLLYAFVFIPTFIRNGIYDVVANNRYRWFGKSETCRVPTPDLKARFLE